MIKIRIRVPDGDDWVKTVDGVEAIIGRDAHCNVQVPLAHVSGVHARVVAGAVVSDLDSTNGVWINDRKIAHPTLMKGSTFRLGSEPEVSPEVEVLEVSLGGAENDARVRRLQEECEGIAERLKEENDALRRRNRELEMQIEQGAAGSGAQAMGSPPTPEPAPIIPPDGGAEAQGASKGSFVDFASFFHQDPAAQEGPDASPDRPPSKPVDPVTAHNRALVLEMIDRLVSEDVGDRLPIMRGSVEEFFTLESFRLLRQVEKAVTRLARDFKELYDMKTMLPDADGNFRTLAADVLTDHEDRDARQRLVNYLDQLRRWLRVSLQANRMAAVRFATEIRRDLSVDGLTEDRPIPAWMKVSGQEGAEYWRRTLEYLRGLEGDRTEERIDEYAREYANEMMEGGRA